MNAARPVVPATLRLREYLRVSQDASGREASPTQQHDDHIVDAEENNFRLHPNPYSEIGSASRYQRKARDEFDLMMADLEEKKFGADGLVLWESSRGSRKVIEWVRLLDILAEQHLRVWVHTHDRLYDPRKARDRKTLLDDAVAAESESGQTSERLMRDHAARARDGRPAGPVPFGYRSVYNEGNGKLIGRVVEPEAAVHVVRLFEMCVEGKSMKAMERDWAAHGIANGRDKPFTANQLRQMLRTRSYIGERVHVPGKSIRWWKVPPEEVEITPAQWPAIVSRETFFQAQAILEDPTRVTRRPGGARHLMSMFCKCDVCDGPLCAAPARGEGPGGTDLETYRCRDHGCVRVRYDELNRFGEKVILGWLSDPKVYGRAKQSGDKADSELADARSELLEARAHYRDVMASGKARRMTLAAFEVMEPAAAAAVDELELKVRELETPSVLRGLIEPGADVASRWAKIVDLSVRRKIASLVLVPERAGQVRIKRSSMQTGVHAPIETRVRVLKVDQG